MLRNRKRLVALNLEIWEVLQLSLAMECVDFVTFAPPLKLPMYHNVPPTVPSELLNVPNFAKLAKLSAWPVVSIE